MEQHVQRKTVDQRRIRKGPKTSINRPKRLVLLKVFDDTLDATPPPVIERRVALGQCRSPGRTGLQLRPDALLCNRLRCIRNVRLTKPNQYLKRVIDALHGGIDATSHALSRLLQRGPQDLVLRRKPVRDRPGRNLQLGREASHRRRLIAIAGNHEDRGIDDLAAP